MPPRPPRSLLRIARRQTVRLLRSSLEPQEIERTLRRTVHQTLDLIPLDARLLMKHRQRTKRLNRQLAWSLAFVAGAVNAGGFMAVKTYTSHVSGAISRAADELAIGNRTLALGAISTVGCFAAGAFFTSMLISFGRRHRFRSHYALSLTLEAGLMVALGVMGQELHQMRRFALPLTVVLMAFIMGMHNSVVTTISSAEVRTTHMTGIATDIGLELGRLLYFNRDRNRRMKEVRANRDRLKLHTLILAAFFGGGLAGAVGFQHLGFRIVFGLAAFLVFLGLQPILYDLRVRRRLLRQSVH